MAAGEIHCCICTPVIHFYVYHTTERQDIASYRIVPDRQIVLSQLKIGEVVWSTILRSINWNSCFEGQGNTFLTRGVVWKHLDFNIDNPLFSDVRVRQAISFAIDRTALIEKTLKNAGFPASHRYPSLILWAYGANLTFPARNLPHARELLAAAGSNRHDGILAKGRRMSFC